MIDGIIIFSAKVIRMEGGPEAKRATSSPYIMRLTLSAGIGRLLFGYDTSVISGALLYIREDFVKEVIVSMAVAGAIIGAALGRWMNDRLGCKTSILGADISWLLALLLRSSWLEEFWLVLELKPPQLPLPIRGALVCINGLLITFGQFLAYLINLAFTKTPRTWRWMLGVAGLPASVWIVLMLTLHESPRWLYNQGKEKESRKILEKIYKADEIEGEIKAMREAVEQEKQEEGLIGQTLREKMKAAFSNVAVRRGLYAGVTAQVAQQFVGINTVMYYNPTIVQFAGIASKSTALALSLVTSGLNVVESILSMLCIHKYGRRKLMLLSLIAIIICVLTLIGVFFQAATTAPPINNIDTLSFGANATCQAYLDASNVSSWNCIKYLKAECAFCASTGGNVSSSLPFVSTYIYVLV
ncbi:hypothetical protein HN51_063794 [Arachis hypogaea]